MKRLIANSTLVVSEIVLVSFDADRKMFRLSFLLVCLKGGVGLILCIHRC